MADTPWLTIIGIGDDGLESLSPAAQILLSKATTVIAPARVLASIELHDCEVVPWTMGLSETIAMITKRQGSPVTILATGDPMHFGIGATLMRRFDAEEMQILPSPSAFSLAAARLGWALQDVAQISLHGRAVAGLHVHLSPGRRIISLTSTARTVGEIAEILTAAGYGASQMVVLEHMGGSEERRSQFTAQALKERSRDFADFNTVGIICIADSDLAFRSTVPGLPDAAFQHDGQLTKREIRAVTLSHLQPFPGGLLWDVGAGCGSVAVEWMRAAPGAKAIAVEQNTERVAMIAQNAVSLGVPTLEIREGKAPDALDGMPSPDAIFIGGGVTANRLLDHCYHALQPGGHLVANAVTVEGEAVLGAFQATHGGTLTRLAVARTTAVGRFQGWKPMMPVTLFALVKGGAT